MRFGLASCGLLLQLGLLDKVLEFKLLRFLSFLEGTDFGNPLFVCLIEHLLEVLEIVLTRRIRLLLRLLAQSGDVLSELIHLLLRDGLHLNLEF